MPNRKTNDSSTAVRLVELTGCPQMVSSEKLQGSAKWLGGSPKLDQCCNNHIFGSKGGNRTFAADCTKVCSPDEADIRSYSTRRRKCPPMSPVVLRQPVFTYARYCLSGEVSTHYSFSYPLACRRRRIWFPILVETTDPHKPSRNSAFGSSARHRRRTGPSDSEASI